MTRVLMSCLEAVLVMPHMLTLWEHSDARPSSSKEDVLGGLEPLTTLADMNCRVAALTLDQGA